MDLEETGRLLAKCAAFDRRTVGEADIRAWHEVFRDIPLADALVAVTRWYSTHREWVMPSDVRSIALDIERDRRRAIRDAQEQAAIDEMAADPTRYDRSPAVRALVEQLRDSLPDVDAERLTRRPELIEWDRARRRREWAEPNPHYDPAVAAALFAESHLEPDAALNPREDPAT